MRKDQSLIISDNDERTLRAMLEGASGFNERDQQQWRALEHELDKARIVPSGEVPRDVVTMNSRVRIVDMRTGEQLIYQIVYPHEANYAAMKISILAPIGMALLGYAEGTEIEWEVPSGSRWLRIQAVEHQPEDARKRVAA